MPDGRRRGVRRPGSVVTAAEVQGPASVPDVTRELRGDIITVNCLAVPYGTQGLAEDGRAWIWARDQHRLSPWLGRIG